VTCISYLWSSNLCTHLPTFSLTLCLSVSPQVTDYSGSVTVINNAAGSVEVDGVLVNLVDTLGDGDTLAEAFADCPLGDSGAVGPVSGSSTLTIPAYGRLSCR